MEAFEGYLEQGEESVGQLTLRFLTGDFDPTPTEPPVFTVVVSHPDDAQAIAERLGRVMQADSWSHVSVTEGQVALQSDHGEQATITGQRVDWERGHYQDRDFKRLAQKNHDWGQSQYQALAAQSKLLSTLQALTREQLRRLEAKAAGHEPGTTARTLYEQQMSFLVRLLKEAK